MDFPTKYETLTSTTRCRLPPGVLVLSYIGVDDAIHFAKNHKEYR